MHTHDSYDSYDVLVVGAGPAGLTTATALAHHGVRTLVVDRHPGTSPFPKATGVSTRTMEILRGWGLEDKLRAGAMPARPGFAVTTALVNPPLAIRAFGYPDDQTARAVSPTTPLACPQDHLEPVMAAHLAEHGVDVQFSTELTAMTVEPEGVTAWLHHGELGVRPVHARYVVGADGPTSLVRTLAGITVDELGRLGEFVAVTFRAELADVPPDPWAAYAIESPEVSAVLIPSGRNGRWVFARPHDGDPTTLPDADWATEIRAATGIAGLEPQILAAFQYTEVASVATRLRAGNVFLVGDAAHRSTPVGGVGLNAAVHAAHNLGWKLAWVIRGWAGETLLDSYETERWPVGHETAWRSLHPELFDDFDGLAAEIGVRYRSPVIVDDGVSGGRAPHRWLRPGMSTLDLFDRRLTLLTGPDARPWHADVRRLAATGLPLATVALGVDVPDPDGHALADLGLTAGGAALVRPDGHIAWRTTTMPDDPSAALDHAVATALGRTGAGPVGAGPTAVAGSSLTAG